MSSRLNPCTYCLTVQNALLLQKFQNPVMNTDEFQRNGRKTIEYLTHYYETLRSRKVTHSVEPGYLKPLVPDDAPQNGEDFKDVLKDVEKLIMPGVSYLNLVWDNRKTY